MVNIVHFPKAPRHREAPTISAKTLGVWAAEEDESNQTQSSIIMQADAGIMTKSRKKRVDTWIAGHAREMKATWSVLR
eukprot:2314806-Pyramimonas_sp.AAC.1